MSIVQMLVSTTMLIQERVASEVFDVFEVRQLTRATTLEPKVAVDQVFVKPGMRSGIHRHHHADTVLVISGGEGEVIVGDEVFQVSAGDRIHIPPGAFHGVKTDRMELSFISIQTPPIQSNVTGILDLEMKG